MLGLDLLGAARFPKLALSSFPHGWAFGVIQQLDGFGDALPLIEAIAKSGKAPAIRVHLMWRDDHAFTASDLPEIRRRGRALNGVMARYPTITWYVSPALENQLSANSAQQFCNIACESCPAADFIVNSTTNGTVLSNVITERHGSHPARPRGPYIVSFDGNPSVDSDSQAWLQTYSSAAVRFLWEPRFNGLWENPKPGDPKPPRPSRVGWPDDKFIQSVVALGTTHGVLSTLPARTLWKSHAENKGNGDTRAEKPCYITTSKVSSITVKTTNGKTLATLKRYDPPRVDAPWSTSKPGYRYYSQTLYGYEMAAQAQKLSGDPRGVVQGMTVHPSFRRGFYE